VGLFSSSEWNHEIDSKIYINKLSVLVFTAATCTLKNPLIPSTPQKKGSLGEGEKEEAAYAVLRLCS
jgi:hypothetical protein